MSKTYKIPCSWEMYGYLHIEADSLEEAVMYADNLPLPSYGQSSYIEESFKVDHDVVEEFNKNADIG